MEEEPRVDVAQVHTEVLSEVAAPQEIQVAQAHAEVLSEVATPQEVQVAQVVVEVLWQVDPGHVYTHAVDLGAYEGDVRGEPQAGDRAAWDAMDYPARHSRDLKEAAPRRHNPWPAAAGEAPVSDGTKYVATDIATQAELDAHEANADAHHNRAHNLDSVADHPDVDPSDKADLWLIGWSAMAGKHVYYEPSGSGGAGSWAPAGYAESVGDGVETTFDVVHSLGTWDVLVQVYDTDDDPTEQVGATVEVIDADTVRVSFLDVPAVDQYRVLVLSADAVEPHDEVTLSPEAADLLALTDQEIDLVAWDEHEVLIGPTSGGAAKPTVRPLEASDLPAHEHVEADVTDLDHTDANAIHDNVAGEIAAVSEKASPVSGDFVLIEDSADGNAKKRAQLGNLPGGGAAGQISTINVIIDGGGSAITTGVKGDVVVDFACTITAATLLADQSGDIVVDIWKDSYANYPPTDADSITSATPPTLSSAVKSQDTTLSGWTTAISAGDVLRFNVDSAATVERVMLALTVQRS